MQYLFYQSIFQYVKKHICNWKWTLNLKKNQSALVLSQNHPALKKKSSCVHLVRNRTNVEKCLKCERFSKCVAIQEYATKRKRKTTNTISSWSQETKCFKIKINSRTHTRILWKQIIIINMVRKVTQGMYSYLNSITGTLNFKKKYLKKTNKSTHTIWNSLLLTVDGIFIELVYVHKSSIYFLKGYRKQWFQEQFILEIYLYSE